MNPDAVLEAFISDPDPKLVSPFMLRLARNINLLQSTLDSILIDPLERACCGVESTTENPPGADLISDIRWAQARLEEGSNIALDWCSDLQQRAIGEMECWVPAARVHASSDPERERQVRMALSEQSLPYVFQELSIRCKFICWLLVNGYCRLSMSTGCENSVHSYWRRCCWI